MLRKSRFLLLVTALLCCMKGIHGFRPPLISQELGCSPTLSWLFGRTYFFDPLKLATDGNFARMREAELKHGRVAMLAVLETMVVPFVRSSSSVSGVAFEQKGGVLPSAMQHSVQDYAVLLVTCAVLEAFVLVQRDPQALPGDYGIGYFGVRDKGLNESSLIAELENGRLAMISISIQVLNEIITGESWEEQWLGFLKEWVRQFL